jgi:hypothetical protein
MSGPASDRDEVQLRLALVLGRYGYRLDAGQIESLRRAVETLVEQVTGLRVVPLANADEPWPRFAPFRGDE